MNKLYDIKVETLKNKLASQIKEDDFKSIYKTLEEIEFLIGEPKIYEFEGYVQRDGEGIHNRTLFCVFKNKTQELGYRKYKITMEEIPNE